MYTKNEKAVVSATIFYYDIEYRKETAQKVLEILEEHMMFPPEKIHADRLTNNTYVCANEKVNKVFVDAYSEKDVWGIDMASGNSKFVQEYWRVNWGLTFYKNSRIVGSCKLMPWNTLTIQSTYGRLESIHEQANYLACIKSLIMVLNPFCVTIDDVDNKIMLQDRKAITHFVPGEIQEIYWANYFDKSLLDRYSVDISSDFPAYHYEWIGNGLFFTLSESLHNYNTKDTQARRKQIRRYLKI